MIIRTTKQPQPQPASAGPLPRARFTDGPQDVATDLKPTEASMHAEFIARFKDFWRRETGGGGGPIKPGRG